MTGPLKIHWAGNADRWAACGLAIGAKSKTSTLIALVECGNCKRMIGDAARAATDLGTPTPTVDTMAQKIDRAL